MPWAPPVTTATRPSTRKRAKVLEEAGGGFIESMGGIS
jgi:hypothetical protein